MRFKSVWCILLILLTLAKSAEARENRAEVSVDFRTNVMRIDSGYSDNASHIDALVSFLQKLRQDSVQITSISLCGSASPEGSYSINRRLAAGRLASLKRLIRREVTVPDSIISHVDSYIPWGYLRDKIAQSDLEYKDEIIAIIDEPPKLVKNPDNGTLVDHRVTRLKRLDGQRVWDEMFRRYFSGMRNARAVISTYAHDPCRVVPASFPAELPLSLTTEVPDIRPLAPIEPSIRPQRRPFYMDVRTNLLYDALGVPNIGAEFYLGKNLSIAGSWMHAWWSKDSRHRYWRIYGGELGARYWFGKAAHEKPLTGHHIGIYCQALTYDFEFGGKAYMGGKPGGTIFDHPHLGVGIEYGYSLPIAKRLNLDFSLGLGYIKGRVYEFIPYEDHYLWTSTKNRQWFGPTKLEVSLVWLIGRGNTNGKYTKAKGGAL